VKALTVFLITLLTLGNAAAAELQSSADESKLVALENAWNLAQVHQDAKALEGLVGDKFIYTDTDGSIMDKRQFLADIKETDYHASLVVNDNVKVYLYPNAAVVAGRYHTKGTYKGKRYEHWGRFTDTWIFDHGLWQCVASHTNLIQK
jgi:hypothetical protein